MMPTLGKLEEAFRENPSVKSLLGLLEYDEAETLDRLRKNVKADDFRFTQGQLEVLAKYIRALSTAK